MIRVMTSDLARVLSRERNTDGGWGYYPGKGSRIEPTCWARLSLRARKPHQELADGAMRWLALRQRPDGLLDEATGGSPNLAFNGLAALSVRSGEVWSLETATRLLEALGRIKGLAAKNSPARQDNALKGWSWIKRTF